MNKIIKFSITIVMIISLTISMLIGKTILEEYKKEQKNKSELIYIQSLDKKIRLLNYIYSLEKDIVDLSKTNEKLKSEIEMKENEISSYKEKNDMLTQKIKFYED